VSRPDLEVHPADLQQIVDILDDAGSSVFGQASSLEATPDAGASSDEVATALAALSSAVAGVAQHIGTLADNTEGTSSDFTGTDQAIGGAMQQRRAELGP
jgi:ABC-type transporter Mla subunit MlaD